MERLDGDLHMMCVGVNHQHAIDHDPDVALPEHEIAASKSFEIIPYRNAFAKFRLLHISIARHDIAGSEK